MTLTRKIVPPLILTCSLLLVYLGTIAPGLTWANDGADGGDFISATATGGIAHPTGYPVYLLVGRLFQALPIGSLAFRTNLLSLLAAILACVFVYGILVWLPSSPVTGNWLAGMIAAFMFGISPVFWSQAVITEVYTLHAAFLAGSMFIFLWIPSLSEESRFDRWRGLLLGLSAGNHITSVLFFPGAMLSRCFAEKWKINWHSLLRIITWLGIGLLIYLILPVRSLSAPPINWGAPTTLRQFTWLVTGELYQERLMDISLVGILDRLQAWSSILLKQFELPGILLGLLGLVYFFKPTRLYFITIWNLVVFSAFAILFSAFDSYLYLIPVFLSFSIWIGLGIGGLLDKKAAQNRIVKYGVAILFACLLVVLITVRWPQVDASQDARAEKFGSRAMEIIPPNGIVFVKSDRAIFALWYYHYALHLRSDISVVAPDLLHFTWYSDTLRSTYPSITWPDDILWQETIIEANPQRPICTASYVDLDEISCEK